MGLDKVFLLLPLFSALPEKNVCIIVFFLTWLLQWPPDLEMTFTLRKVGIADLILNRYQNGEIKSESCKANFKLVKTESWDLSFYCFEILRLNSKNSNQNVALLLIILESKAGFLTRKTTENFILDIRVSWIL